MTIRIRDEERAACIASIRRFFAETLEDEIGDLRATQILNYCLEEIGPLVYNRAVRDAGAYFLQRVEDLDGSCWEPEFPYWNRRDGNGSVSKDPRGAGA